MLFFLVTKLNIALAVSLKVTAELQELVNFCARHVNNLRMFGLQLVLKILDYFFQRLNHGISSDLHLRLGERYLAHSGHFQLELLGFLLELGDVLGQLSDFNLLLLDRVFR
jgi:hypothetical protein